MRNKFIPIPARLFVLIFLALLTVSFLPSFTPPACAGTYNDSIGGRGSGGPDDPSGNPPLNKTTIRPKDPTQSVTLTPPSQQTLLDLNGHDGGWVSRMLQVVRLVLQGYLHLS